MTHPSKTQAIDQILSELNSSMYTQQKLILSIVREYYEGKSDKEVADALNHLKGE